MKTGYPTASLIILLFLTACASVGGSFSAGEPKNSLPLISRDLAEEVHSIAVPPFSGDSQAWSVTANEYMAEAARIKTVPQKRLDQAIKSFKKDPSALPPEERLEYAARLGRALQADAVLNGMIIVRENSSELIMQLVSSRDSRVLWWQSADFFVRGQTVSGQDQKQLLSKLLSSLLPSLGKKEKTAPDQIRDSQSQTPQPRPGKRQRPSTRPDSVSPM